MGNQIQKPNKLEPNLIQNLPTSAFQKVLEFLNKPNLRSCRQVCKLWNENITTSPIFYSNNIYDITKNVDSIKPLLSTTIDWPALRFIGCFNLGNKMLNIPPNIIYKITTLHVSQCIINKKCLNQIFGITTIIDLRLEHCHLANSIFKNTVSETTTLPLLGSSSEETPLNIQCVNINNLTISMCDRDISYLVDQLFPHLNHLNSLIIQEMSQYSILHKLQRHQIKSDYYGFKNVEFENTTNIDGNDIQLEKEFLPFLFELDSVHHLQQLVNVNQMMPDLGLIPMEIPNPNAEPEVQIHELETLIQEDFLEQPIMGGNGGEYEDMDDNLIMGQLNNDEGILDGNEIIGAGVIMLQIEEGQNAGVDQAEILEEQLNQIEEDQNVGVDQVEILEEQLNQLNINPPEILDNAEEIMEQDIIPSSDLNPTIQKFLEVIIRNSQTLEEIDFSFRRSFHPWNVQLFTHLIPTILENKLQLKSLILNSFNIPMRNVFFPDGHTQNELQPLFSTNVAVNLKQFFKSQIRLKKLILGLKQIHPTLQLEILKEIPQTVEILTIWPIDIPGMKNIFNQFQNLKEIRIPQDSTTLDINAIMNVNNDENVPVFIQEPHLISMTQQLFQNVEQLPNLKSFKGEIFHIRSDMNDFTKVTTNLTELELKSSRFGDIQMQLIIQNLKKLKRLVLSYVYISDSGITGIKSQEIILIKKFPNYPNILENLQLVRTGLPISDLIYLQELKIDRLRISNFGIYYGLQGLKLKMLDLDSKYLRRTTITDWGLNILALQSNQLEVLHLNIGYGVTEQGMKNFITKLASLNLRSSKISHLSRTTFMDYYKSKEERQRCFANNTE